MTRPDNPSRSRFVRALACTPLLALLPPMTAHAATAMKQRPIPSTGQMLGVIGCGTYIGFDVAKSAPEISQLKEVIGQLLAAGGSVLDSSPMYGQAEAATGAALDGRPAFLATKVWTQGREAGIAQMEASFQHLRTRKIDLMQIHNLLDWRTHLPVLRDWKAAGRIGYIGITHYSPSAYDAVEAVLRQEPLDFLQINYALDDREAARRLLPLAADRGVAVLVNRPFGGGGLLRKLSSRPLPAWAGDIGAGSWAQLLLKFALSHPAVTCAIPGTSRPAHMADNAAAGAGKLPPASFWTPHMDDFT